MIIRSSINCPTVICSPIICYFSREKPLVKPTATGSISHIFAFAIYFSFAFIFRSINPKNTKILCCTLFYLRSIYSIYYNFLPSRTNFWHRCPNGIGNPFNTSGCEDLLSVCRGCLRCVVWFSCWFDNLGFLSEGNTYRRCAASSLPLWGNTDVASSDIKRNFWCRCRGGSSTYTRFLIRNLISSQFTLFSICISFSSPPLHKKLSFYSPLFLVRLFLVRTILCLQS